MKIAMIGHKRIPGREGGIEVVVEELAIRMASAGNEVVAYNRSKKNYKSPKVYRGVKLVDVPTIEKKSTDAVVYSFFATIRALFGNYDVIHYHAVGPSAFIFIPHFFRKRVIVTVHGLNYKTPKWKGFGAKFLKFGEKMTAKYADEIIVLSHEQQKYFKRKYNRNTIYIPNGISIEQKEEPDIILKKYSVKKYEYILFLSRVVPGKGLEYLLDAYREIDSGLKLIVAGTSEYLPEFRKMIEKKAALDNRVEMVGFVSGKELIELYSNAKLFIFPSEAEGMPMCLLEAMSFDCPCLVSDIPENLEVGKGYVESFKSKDINDLKEKLKMCLARENNVSTRTYVETNYSWETVVNQTLDLYMEK